MFRKLLTLDEAKETICRYFKPKPLGFEEVALLEAHSRVLAESIKATLDIPPFSRSTIDGYAVRSADTFHADENQPVRLRICGTVNIGELPQTIVETKQAAEIVTGAPMPEGADAAVMVEHSVRKGGFVHVFSAVAKDENTMKAGADIRKGKVVLRAGQLLGYRQIGVLAAVGVSRVRVHVAPRVAVLSTGAEVAEPGTILPSGKIYDINSYSLTTAVLESGGKPIRLGVSPDDRNELQKNLVKALKLADMVITSGGVSVGPKDIVPQTVNSLGKPGVILSGIAIRPGKPTTVALVDGKPVFSLPGHPTSALLVFHLLVCPLLTSMTGRKSNGDLKTKATAGMRLLPAKGRRTFVMVKLRRDEGGQFIAEPVESGASGAITTFANAEGYVEVPENTQFIDAGEQVLVQLFKNTRGNEFLAC